MRLAALILGYRAPQVLALALPVLERAGFDVFLHVDAKADLGAYLRALGPAGAMCQTTSDRVDVFWAGFSMMRAELALLQAAYRRQRYDRLVLLSDDCFPLIGPAALRRLMSDDIERISLRRLEAGDPFLARYQGFYCFDHAALTLLPRPIEASALDAAAVDLIEGAAALMRRGKKPIPIFYASQWWALTGAAADRVLEVWRSDAWLVDSFRYAAVPDEIMISTIIGNFAAERPVCNSPVLVDWSREPRPYVFAGPAEAAAMAEPHHGFARKIRGDSGPELLAWQARLLAGG